VTEPSWHGWAHEANALYLAPTPDGEHIALYLQVERETELAAVFMDPAMAEMVMGFLDASLGATAAANAELLRRLQTEQPLLFVGQQAARDEVVVPRDPLLDDDD
jgi:hypothetical protein